MQFCSLAVVFVFGRFLGLLKKWCVDNDVGYDFSLDADMT